MPTSILKPNQIDSAVELLKNGEVVAIPTETVYGLAADARNDQALQKVFSAKGRPTTHPLIIHIESIDKAEQWAYVTNQARELAQQFWPGPLTLLFRKRDHVSKVITGGLDTIALRIPAHPVALQIIRQLGNGIAAPSANAHKKTSPTNPEHVLHTLDGKIAAIIDGGVCAIGIESTIVDMTQDTPVILRPGAITAKMIATCLGLENVDCPISHTESVSGNLQNHYQPDTPLYILTKEDLLAALKSDKRFAIIHYSNLTPEKNNTYYKLSSEPNDYANRLYEVLHEIDKTEVKRILVEKTPQTSEWAGVNDRLEKAAVK